MPKPIRSILLAVLALVAPAGLAAQDEGLALGARPDTPVLERIDGGSLDLATVVGERPVVVEFWATWCGVCRALEPRMQAARERYGDDVEFLVVAVGVAQDPDGIRRHIQRHPVSGTLLWDEKGEAVRAFEAPGTGYVVILDRDGTVAYTGTGAAQDLIAALSPLVGR